jgi:hypothetical protein
MKEFYQKAIIIIFVMYSQSKIRKLIVRKTSFIMSRRSFRKDKRGIIRNIKVVMLKAKITRSLTFRKNL